jgi:hypothetical protein
MVTCLALTLAATQSIELQSLEDSQSHQRLTIAIGNKQINKQYLMSKQIVPKYATHRYKCVSAGII